MRWIANYFNNRLYYLGIPCIGYEGLDSQELCHPWTTVKPGDLTKAKEIRSDMVRMFIKTKESIYKEDTKESIQS